MLELTINGAVYEFRFDMGFLREINKKVKSAVDGLQVSRDAGLAYFVAALLDGDVEALVEVLNIANRGASPRVTVQLLDRYIDEECEDIDDLFRQVLDFLASSNATKKITKALMDDVQRMKELMATLP